MTMHRLLQAGLLIMFFTKQQFTAALLNEPINLKRYPKPSRGGDPSVAQPLFRSPSRWRLDAGESNVEALRKPATDRQDVAPSVASPVLQNQSSVQAEQREAAVSNGKSQRRKPGRPFIIRDEDEDSSDSKVAESTAPQKIADDSFLDEVIKSIVASKRGKGVAARSAVVPDLGQVAEAAAAAAASGTKRFNVSSAEKVVGENHPMELGKVKVRPPHVVLSNNDTLLLECFVGYNTHASVSWTLNDRVLLEVDESKVQTIDYKGVKVMVSSILIRNVLKLPTFKEIYVFKCIYLFDDEMQTAQSVVHARVTDDCQTDQDCAPRNARCVNSRCSCSNTQYPVKLQSVHTTCRVEAFLETECLYDEQCESVEPKSECTVHHWCACIHGYARDAWSNCLPKNSGLKTRCNSDRDCADLGASCVLSHCSCLGDTDERGGKCVARTRSSNELLRRSLVAKVTQSVASPQHAAFALSSTLTATALHCLLVRLLTPD
ncbi:hypothetical protein V5799_028916 [Amblyomma americanum]|uniref:Ig-like domain-containing protein n=1 Tax=Amblyomma americanum TaxID=6943 RepID=A0AAQ4DBH6_AMBAM